MFDPFKIPPNQTVLIAGPTASGKSALALRIAEACGGVIVNADALQVYACWNILSARPDTDELSRAPHALYGHAPCTPAYSVGDWLRDVKALTELGDRLIIVGGTGLYLSSLTEGLSDVPEIPRTIRARADTLREQDFPGMRAQLKSRDPVLANRIDLENPMRVQRGWEVFEATGRPLSDWQATKPAPLVALGSAAAIVLEAPKDWLTPRIDRRFEAMMTKGALEEVRANAAHWQDGAPWTRAIGAVELLSHLRGEVPLEQAVLRAQIATRQFAKRQRTWFKARMSNWTRIFAQDL
ncbi:tRNA (adenosine(37)-N6)-dimethylallyltransferase MiaA [Tropicimonas sp. S265A]|uniref:tRNA (adenosine(37)-N6)-dimethylallyltransferase MiaA n=1 Tax=Tropicimonas sp. S265A TaxID=3415134 RepID=UPI003C7AF9B8